jgi:large repetitive protein
MRSLLVCVLLVAVSAVAVEVPFTPAAHGPAAADQYRAAVASDGTDFLVVWRDERTRPNEAYATRVSRDGAVLDPTGIRIPFTDPFDAQVIWTGSAYLVVWWSAEQFAIIGARVSRDGVLVDGPRVLVQDAQLPSLIRAGEHTVLGFMAGRSAPRSEVSFLDAGGREVSRIAIPAGPGDNGAPILGWNGSQLVAVWISGSSMEARYGIVGMRLDQHGVIDREPRVLAGDGYNLQPRIASDGRDFAVVFRDANRNVHRSMRVNADLTAAAPVDLPLPIGDEPSSLLWSGTSYVVLYEHIYEINALRLDRDAKPSGTAVNLDTPYGLVAGTRAASNGSELLIAWAAMPPKDPTDLDVNGTIVSASTLSSRSKTLLSVTAPRQTDPVIASSGRNVLAVWNEAGGAYARRLTVDGSVADANPIRLGPASLAAEAVFNGTDYLVAMLARQSGAAVTLSTVRIPATGNLRVENRTDRGLSYNAASVAMASRNGTTLLAWQSDQAIDAVRLSANGSWLDAVPLAVARGRVRRVAAAAGGDPAFLVTWEEYTELCCHGQTTTVAIRGARVSSGATLLDPASLTIAAAEGVESHASATWNGREWVVAWQRIAGAASEIRARRIASNGTLVDGPVSDPGVLLATSAALPRVAWDGTRYVLTWVDYAVRDTTVRMHAARFTDAFERAGSSILGEAEAFAASGRPSIAVVSPGVAVVGYARIAREPAYGGVARGFLTIPEVRLPRRRAV